MKIAATVILYEPKVEEVLNNINTFINYVDSIYLYDNTEVGRDFDYTRLNSSKVHYFRDGQNKGLSVRLNEASKKAISDQYKWLLTMDQDSFFLASTIQKFITGLSVYEDNNSIGVFGLSNTSSSTATINEINTGETIEVNHVITSGSVINLSVYNEVSGFDENLFIDGVDWDYCISLKLAGYSVIQFKNLFMEHQLGTRIMGASIKTLYLIKKEKYIHNPLRCYYLKRNMLYLQNKYKDYKLISIKEMTNHTNAHLKTCLYYGGDFIKTISMINKAKKDYKNNKMGNIIN